MIVLHSYSISATKSGPDDFSKSLEACRVAIDNGIKTVVTVPRWPAGLAEPPLPFAHCGRQLKQLERDVDGALTLKTGFLLEYSSALPALVDRFGDKLALNCGRYLLVSPPSLSMPTDTEAIWQQLHERKYSAIVSRPECSPALRRSPALLEGWVGGGVVLQLDAASITGAYGREVQNFAMHCLKKYEDRIFVAANAPQHSAWHLEPHAARERLIKTLGVEAADRMLEEVPAAILNSGSRAYPRSSVHGRSISGVIRRTLRNAANFANIF